MPRKKKHRQESEKIKKEIKEERIALEDVPLATVYFSEVPKVSARLVGALLVNGRVINVDTFTFTPGALSVPREVFQYYEMTADEFLRIVRTLNEVAPISLLDDVMDSSKVMSFLGLLVAYVVTCLLFYDDDDDDVLLDEANDDVSLVSQRIIGCLKVFSTFNNLFEIVLTEEEDESLKIKEMFPTFTSFSWVLLPWLCKVPAPFKNKKFLGWWGEENDFFLSLMRSFSSAGY